MDAILKSTAWLKAQTGWAPAAGTLKLVLGVLAALLALAVLAKLAGKLWARLGPLLKAPAVPPLCGCEPAAETRAKGWIERASLALDYLRTGREWRYATPWLLMLGQAGAGKTSLLESVGPQHTQPLGERQQSLALEGASWHAIDQSLVLDPLGKWPEAAASAMLDSGTADGADARRWLKFLDQLDALRPERALDGIVLVVCATTFLQRDPARLMAAAQNARQQLRTIEDRLEFALPVYVVVTACDHVEGFGAFWRSQAPQRHTEMVGWSAPSQTFDTPPTQWGAQIFAAIGAQLRALQVETAAHCERIAADDADPMFLYPLRFAQLQGPFEQWLSVVFQVSAWETTFFLRGVYFTGLVAEPGEPLEARDGPRRDVAFVRDLMLEKVLAEKHLARPTRAGVWSRNLLIRRVQWACVIGFSLLLLAFAVRVWMIDAQIGRVIQALERMQQLQAPAPGAGCIAQAPVYQLIEQVAQIDADASSWLLPASLFDSRLSHQSARRVIDTALRKVILPGLACQLSQRAYALGNEANRGISAGLGYTQALDQLQGFVQQADQYERNAARFQRLLGKTPYARERVPLPGFFDLVEYAYRTPVPPYLRAHTGLLPVTLGDLTERDFSGEIATPPQLRQSVGNHIVALAAQAGSLLQAELQSGLPLLEQLQARQQPILAHVRQFTHWLNWIRTAWLGSSAAANPILTVQNQLLASLQPLVADFGYPSYIQAQVSAQFDAAHQYPLAMQTLNALTLPGYGALFVNVNGQITLNPAMQGELTGLDALGSLGYMSIDPLASFSCTGKLANWSQGLLKDAAQYPADYRKFLAQPMLKGGQPDALYRQLARYQLELAMNNQLAQAQAAAGYAASGTDTSTEAQQSADSGNFAAVAPLVLNVEQQFRALGMDGSATQLTQCAHQYANSQLGRISLLADQSQLYQPAYLPASPAPDAYFFDLGSTPVVTDMLARQVSRVQVLVGYAQPFLTYLGQAGPSASNASANTANAAYWNNTASELRRYTQGKDPNSQPAVLDNLFLKLLPALQNDNCGEQLAAYSSPALGNDLFSNYRGQLMQGVQMHCKGERYAQAQNAFQPVASRFTRDLAGRYPFGTLDADDASLDAVKGFFTDYEGRRAALQKQVAGINDPYWKSVRQFLAQLDQVDAFLQGNVAPGTAPGDPAADPLLSLNVNFRALKPGANGSNQIIEMNLVSGAKGASFPNGGSTLDWQFGQPLVLDLSWAGLSPWRPSLAVGAPDLQVDGNTASFAAAGNWALLRMMERHRPSADPATDPRDATRSLLQFDVPVLDSSRAGSPATDTAHVFLGIRLSNVNAKNPTPLKLPAVFPISVPPLTPRP
ncbi:type VI secretion system protein [Burkholderia glumae]|uniref:type VI secretion system protein n=1 Tax=Burkholderia glumae TaxID=337 RepID=UPI0012964FA2|nr:type VI secretion system protein [Burkholderia glumae]MCM2550617.1 type VI secretion system protein [Burkholderia glumae]QGA40424.1 type VI secretion protein [Burkholderia glumae]